MLGFAPFFRLAAAALLVGALAAPAWPQVQPPDDGDAGKRPLPADAPPTRRGESVPFRVEVEAPGPLKSLLAQHLDVARYAERDDLLLRQLERAASRADEDARELLATEGYFAATVQVALDQSVSPAVVRVRVDPGPRTTVRKVSVDVGGGIASGAGADPERVRRLQADWRLGAGAPFRQEAWGSAKDALLRSLLVDRFPYARIVESRAEVTAEAAAADISVRVDSGPMVRLGDVEVVGLRRYGEANVRNLKPFGDREPYTQEAILDYQARLQTSGYFESAVVSIDPPGDQAVGEDVITVPIRVTVIEEPYQEIRLGAGFSTNTGFRVSAEHEHNDLLRRNYRLLSEIRLESRAQLAQTQLVSPHDPRGYRYQTQVRLDQSDIQGLKTQAASVSFGQLREFRRIDTALTAQLLFERSEPSGGERVDETTVVTGNYSWTYRDVDSMLVPTRGYIVNLQGGGGMPVAGSGDSGFVRAYAKGAAFFPVGEADTVILRGELGRVFASSRHDVPEAFLFRAGGDQSVRGYSFDELGVAEGDAIVGGRYLFTASAEYVHQILRDWGIAAFVDAGNAADSAGDLKPVYGYGIGARWRSPVGMVALDVAYGEAKDQFRIHLSLGFTF